MKAGGSGDATRSVLLLLGLFGRGLPNLERRFILVTPTTAGCLCVSHALSYFSFRLLSMSL